MSRCSLSKVMKWAEEIRSSEGGEGWETIKPSSKAFGNSSCSLKYLKHPCKPDSKKTYPTFYLTSTLTESFNKTLSAMSDRSRMVEYNRIMREDTEELEVVDGGRKVIRAKTKNILFLSPKTFVTVVQRRWLKNDDGTMSYCLLHRGLEEDPVTSEVCSGIALGGCLWLDPIDGGSSCKISMVFGFDMKLPSFLTSQLISMVASTYPFKFVAELSAAAAKTPFCASPPQVTGIAHIGFLAYFKEEGGSVGGDFSPQLDGYETDDEEWEEDELTELSKKGRDRRSSKRAVFHGVKKLGKKTVSKTKDMFTGVVMRSDS